MCSTNHSSKKKYRLIICYLKRKNTFVPNHMKETAKNIINLAQFCSSDLVLSTNLLEREREREREYMP